MNPWRIGSCACLFFIYSSTYFIFDPLIFYIKVTATLFILIRSFYRYRDVTIDDEDADDDVKVDIDVGAAANANAHFDM